MKDSSDNQKNNLIPDPEEADPLDETLTLDPDEEELQEESVYTPEPIDRSELSDLPEETIQLYLRDIKQDALLDVAQEFHLGMAVQAVAFLSAFKTEDGLLDYSTLYQDMQSSWQQVLNDCKHLKIDPPELDKVVAEASKLHAIVVAKEPSYIRKSLESPNWGQDKHWDELARNLFRFATDAYLLPVNTSKKISESCCKDARLDSEDQHSPWLPTPAELHQTLEEITANAKAAAHALVENNLRLVISVAKRYNFRGTGMMDLIQEGNMGLLKAIQKFDPARGFRFSTYATWWIRQSISRYLNENARTIRIPVHMVEMISKLIKVQHNLVQSLGRDPTFAEMAVQSGFLADEDVKAILELGDSKHLADPGLLHRWEGATQKVEQILKSAEEPVSLESPVGDEDNSTLGDYIEDVDAEEPMADALRNSLKEMVQTSLGNLSIKEREVLEMRFGLLDGVNRSLEEISSKFGLTRERIRQIEASALRKLRDPHHTNPLRDFYQD
jgi:RNA polymerase primary sigma factor